MTDVKRPKVFEVIVSTLFDAIEAEAGGADRLEVVRDLESGGLTPDLELVRQIAESVHIPIRVMLRENAGMQLDGPEELDTLLGKANEISRLKVDGLVAGYIKGVQIDVATMHAITKAVPDLKITFHRAFDDLPDPIQSIQTLKTIPQIDRILTVGGEGSWSERKLRLHHWQACAAPEITILAGAGLLMPVISDLRHDAHIREIHIGRAARIPPDTNGKVSRTQVAQLKGSTA